GIAGLEPTIEAIKSGKNIALANKETLVTGGHIVMPLAKEYNVKILPVDSEHSAIFQALMGNSRTSVKKLILTASGGPFFGRKREELEDVTPEEALVNPNWDMGAKVTIDSSTLANKGLEVIEANRLFGIAPDKIEVLVHRQSIVHSMVQYEDNSVIAQLGAPDMRLPIQFALTYPERFAIENNEIDFSECENLTFEKPDIETFPALGLAYRAVNEGGIMPCVFNSADEAAVEMFLRGKLKFYEIPEKTESAMNIIKNMENPTLSDILETDRAVRELVKG
ncbi:MAG: 1-deoxy-D-xylulose-5-phosphate reductoisomerase, partial [Oscillospiraceae bacterium]|nr:1-deoxy-D-xylulose-5-phosphate reductoisomerase [Oscillospiraceae bacterium]